MAEFKESEQEQNFQVFSSWVAAWTIEYSMNTIFFFFFSLFLNKAPLNYHNYF